MKILHVIYDDTRNPWCGGGGALRTQKINEYLASENNIIVLTGNFPNARNEIINGVNYIRVGLPTSYLISRLSFTLLVPFYMRMFEKDVIVNDVSYFSPCFANLYTKCPVVNIIHHLMGKHSFRLYHYVGLFPFVAEKIFIKICDNIITSAEGVKQTIQKKCPLAKIVAIPNAVSDKLFQIKSKEMNFILFLGRIDLYMKGLDILLNSIPLVKNRGVVLKIAGRGKNRDMRKVKKLIHDLQLEERVKFLGRVGEKEKRELLRTCLFLVMPSRFEGWGISAIEANAVGKPVLGTDIKGLSEAVNNGKTSLLIEPENRKKLAYSIDFLIENHDERKRLGKNGRHWAKNFSWPAIAAKQYKFYKSVLEVTSQ